MLRALPQLAPFFRRQGMHDFLFPNFISLMNENDWEIKAAFCVETARQSGIIGRVSTEGLLWPCLDQCLRDLAEERVLLAALRACLLLLSRDGGNAAVTGGDSGGEDVLDAVDHDIEMSTPTGTTSTPKKGSADHESTTNGANTTTNSSSSSSISSHFKHTVMQQALLPLLIHPSPRVRTATQALVQRIVAEDIVAYHAYWLPQLRPYIREEIQITVEDGGGGEMNMNTTSKEIVHEHMKNNASSGGSKTTFDVALSAIDPSELRWRQPVSHEGFLVLLDWLREEMTQQGGGTGQQGATSGAMNNYMLQHSEIASALPPEDRLPPDEDRISLQLFKPLVLQALKA
ncbi:unnamed protein product, partial [Amoebophrya sp. A25]